MSPLPLGILAASGAAEDPAFVLISTRTFTSGSTNHTFSSIPSGYRHLQLRGMIRSDGSTTNNRLQIRVNGDSTSNYDGHFFTQSGNSIVSQRVPVQNRIVTSQVTSGVDTANVFTPFVCDILDYGNTSKRKTFRTLLAESSSSAANGLNGNFWNSNSAITSIELAMYNGSNFVAGSKLALYGIKG